jgi:murein DD-endopeptidase MepM/ murein hydrolase activator NlpD
MFSRSLRRLVRQPVTLMLLPHDSTHTIKLKVPALLLAVLAGGWLASLVLAVVFVGRGVHYEAMRMLNASLAEENAEYARQVATAEAVAARLVPLERELRRELARTRNTAGAGGGTGGPTTSFLPSEIPTRVARLVEAGDRIFRDYQGLAAMVASTPSGWPAKGWITSEFGERVNPATGEVGTIHQGIDIANKTGTPVLVAGDGLVIQSGWTSGYGKMVEIVHGYGYTTIYGHCSRIKVSAGQKVRKGDILGYMGATGNATGPHCHYEVRLYGVPVNPRAFMK